MKLQIPNNKFQISNKKSGARNQNSEVRVLSSGFWIPTSEFLGIGT